ncbi:MAG TPA: hypothetical protein VFV50_19375 [Bdellovibrionales bacterium]|nr:hypothetical protein [Bdellovibrionales bacterium]
MSKPRVDFLFVLLLWAIGLVGFAAWEHFRLLNAEALYPWSIGAVGGAAALAATLSPSRRFILVAFVGGALATAIVDGPRALLALLALETFLILSWNGRDAALEDKRLHFALGLGLFGAAAYQLPEYAPYLVLAFFSFRSLIVPNDADEEGQRALLFALAGVSGLHVLFLSGLTLVDGAELVLGGVALVAAIFGRPWPALISAFAALCRLEPQNFIFAGPLLALLTGGLAGARAASILCGALTYFVLTKQLSDENMIGIAMPAVAAGLVFWQKQPPLKVWPGLTAATGALAASIYFNLDWYLSLQPISAPEELAGAAAWGLSVGLGYWLYKKALPLRVRLPKRTLNVPQIRWPRMRAPERPFAIAENLASSQYFVVFGFLGAASLLVWLAGAFA